MSQPYRVVFTMAERKTDRIMERVYYACSRGDFESLLQLEKEYEDLDPWNCCRPIHFATAFGNLDMVRSLVEVHHCNPRCKSPSGSTPLHFACYYGHVEMVKYLVFDQKCDLYEQNYYRLLPLHYAYDTTGGTGIDTLVSEHIENKMYRKRQLRHYEVVKCLLIDNPYNLQKHSTINTKPLLLLACEYGTLEDIVYLIQEKQIYPWKSYYGRETSPVHIACQNGKLDLLKYLVEENSCAVRVYDLEGNTPLHLASKNKHVGIVRYLMAEQHCDPTLTNHRGELPLHLAAKSNCLEIVILVSDFSNQDVKMSFSSLGKIVSSDHLNCEDRNGITPLHLACKEGTVEMVKYLVEKKADPNIKSLYGELPLHFACRRQSLEMVKLVSNCSNVNQVANGKTPLYIACESGHLYTVEYLINEKHCDLHLCDHQKLSPIHAACRGSIAVVDYLCSLYNFDLECRTMGGATPLHFACETGRLEMVKYLLEKRQCDPLVQDSEGLNVLFYACGYDHYKYQITDSGHVEVAKYLICNWDFNPMIETKFVISPMEGAISTGNQELMKVLQCAKVFSNEKSNILLHMACKYKNLEAAIFLTEERLGCEVTQNKHGQLPLHIACEVEDIALIQLVSHCDVNTTEYKRGDTPLHVACRTSNEEVVKFLIQEKHCDTTIPNKAKKLPLHIACESGSLNIVKLVSKCDVNATTEVGNNPLHTLHYWVWDRPTIAQNIAEYLVQEEECDPTVCQPYDHYIPIVDACRNRRIELLKVLATAHSLKYRDESGNTLLHIAGKENQEEVVSYLTTKAFFQLDVQNRIGNTALHEACLVCNLAIVKLVISNGTLNIQNHDGDTPLHIACNHCRRDDGYIAQFLINKKHCNTNIQNQQGMAPIHFAVRDDSEPSLKLVQLLCGLNPQVLQLKTAAGDTLLHTVLKEGSISTLKCVLKQLTNIPSALIIPNSAGDLPLHIACKSRNLLKVQLVSSNFFCNPDCQNNDGDTPLHIASRNGDVEIIHHLVKKMSCSTSIQNEKGESPLHLAAQHAIICVDEELQNPNMHTESGNTLLHIAWRCRKFEAAHYLLREQKCDPNLQNENGELPLHLACQYIHDPNLFLSSEQQTRDVSDYFTAASSAIDFLCSCTHDPNLPMFCGDTSLHLACKFATTEIVKLLTIHPAVQKSFVIQNNNGELPLHIACCRNSNEMAELVSHCNPDTQLVKGGTQIQSFERHLRYGKYDHTTAAGDTALHIACRAQSIELVTYLVKIKCQNTNIQNSTGELPLHIACNLKSSAMRNEPKKSLKMIQLVSDCNPNLQTQSGDTPLHLLLSRITDHLYSGSLHDIFMIVRYLIQDKNCDLSIQNDAGQLPLHVMCNIDIYYHSFSWKEAEMSEQESILEVIQMICEGTADINLRTQKGDTPLHIALRNIHGEKIIQYLLKLNRCKFDIVNDDNELPLHYACRSWPLDVVKQVSMCDVNSQTITGDTPLHEVCRNGARTLETCELQVIRYLTEVRNADIRLKNEKKELPLHIACRRQYLEMAQLVCNCNPNVKTEKGNTPLLEVCIRNSLQSEDYDDYSYDSDEDHSSTESDISFHFNCSYHNEPHMKLLQFLIKERGCDPESRNVKGRTPLHYLCESNSIKAVRYILSTGRVNPSIADENGQTPIMLTTDLEITKLLLSYGADATSLYKLYRKFFQSKNPPSTPLKVLVIGNTSMGKTTLIESLKNEAHEATLADPKLHTAGIIPNDFESKIYGSVILYDFAGHHEYYASHEAVVHNIIKKSPPVIFLLISIAESEDDIKRKLLYWLSFIDNRCMREKPHLIVVGSHADTVQTGAQFKMDEIAASLQLRVQRSSLTYVAAIAMDCRRSHSPEIFRLRSLLKESSAQLRDVAVMNFICHCFCVFFQDRFRQLPAIQVKRIVDDIAFSAENRKSKLEALLPTDTPEIMKICEDLNDKGHVIFLQNQSNPLSSWVVLKKEDLLSTVNGTVFAPANFEQYKTLASSTGVVPFSKFKAHFQRHDPNMLVGFLSHMEFCQEIKDKEILKLLSDDMCGLKVKEEFNHSSERYFFFPRLVSIVTPQSVWKKNPRFVYQWGWMLQTIEDDQFFTPHFLQVLILRLSLSYALVPSKPCKSHDFPTIRRVCSVWKRGISWTNRDGVETVVEILEQNQAVVVMMRCFKMPESQVQCLHLRSSIIQNVLEARDEFCPKVSTLESLIHPDDLQYPPKPGSETILFHISGVAQTVMEMKPCVHDDSDVGEIISTEELLFFEPYCDIGRDLIVLFDQKNEDVKVTDTFVDKIVASIVKNTGTCLEQKKELFLKILPQSTECTLYEPVASYPEIPIQLKRMFQNWCAQTEGTYGHLRRELDKYSIFCGRNPQEIAPATLQRGSGYFAELVDSSHTASLPSHEYERMLQNSDTIISQLAAARCSGHLADKLRSRRLISEQVYEEGLNVGPKIVESTRIRVMMNTVLAKVRLNSEHHCTFIHILTELGGLEDIIQLLQG